MEKSRENNSISVIIPIYNAEKFLPDLFEALERSDFKESDEVLLVDNGSADGSIRLCEEAAARRPDLYKCLSYTEKAGSYAARNYGLQHAGSDVLVFTDSDCKPTQGWIAAIREHLRPQTVIAGKIEIEIVNNGLWECYDTIAHLNSEANARKNRVATANMAVFREDFFKVGPFEERFSGGDYDWSMRAAQKGLKILFVPAAMVYHPSRKTFLEVLKKEQRIAYGVGNHYKIQNRSMTQLILVYILRIFKLDTNVRHCRRLRGMGVSVGDLVRFNAGFLRIRIEHLKYAIRGYKQIDVRKMGIK